MHACADGRTLPWDAPGSGTCHPAHVRSWQPYAFPHQATLRRLASIIGLFVSFFSRFYRFCDFWLYALAPTPYSLSSCSLFVFRFLAFLGCRPSVSPSSVLFPVCQGKVSIPVRPTATSYAIDTSDALTGQSAQSSPKSLYIAGTHEQLTSIQPQTTQRPSTHQHQSLLYDAGAPRHVDAPSLILCRIRGVWSVYDTFNESYIIFPTKLTCRI